MFVILEGFDKTGKTAIKKEFGKLNSWEQIIIDRGPAGYLFYDMVAGRSTKDRLREYKRDAVTLVKYVDSVAVYCAADKDTIIQRHKEVGEVPPFDKTMYDEYVEAYFGLTKACYGRGIIIVKVDTAVEDINQTMQKIQFAIEMNKGAIKMASEVMENSDGDVSQEEAYEALANFVIDTRESFRIRRILGILPETSKMADYIIPNVNMLDEDCDTFTIGQDNDKIYK